MTDDPVAYMDEQMPYWLQYWQDFYECDSYLHGMNRTVSRAVPKIEVEFYNGHKETWCWDCRQELQRRNKEYNDND